MIRVTPVLAAAIVLSGCALKGDVRRVEEQVLALKAETARADSARAVELARVIELLSGVQDTLGAQQLRLVSFQADVRADITEVQRQLVQVQELTGQSQQRLSEMRAQLEQRSRLPQPAPGPADTMAPVVEEGPGPEQLYDISLQQFRRGSLVTARAGFQRFLADFPRHDRVPDALFFLGETWAATEADSAVAVYERVVRDHPNSPRAPSALYRLGLMAEQRGDSAAARVYYNRVVSGYPRSEEAALARDKLRGE